VTQASDAVPIASCSFCLRPNTEVVRLVAGPGVCICDQCVGACADLVARSDVPVAKADLWDRDLSDEALLAQLPAMAAVAAQVEAMLTDRVRKARAKGATWARIGAALGMTRQSAWERFSGEE